MAKRRRIAWKNSIRRETVSDPAVAWCPSIQRPPNTPPDTSSPPALARLVSANRTLKKAVAPPRTRTRSADRPPKSDMATLTRKERQFGIIGTASTAAKDESLEEFLKDFSSSVAQSSVVSVKEGKAKYLKEIPHAGTELEKQLKEKAKTVDAPLPPQEAFVAPQTNPEELKKEAWPEMESTIYQVSQVELDKAAEQEAKDNASVFSRTSKSIRESIKSGVSKMKQNGVSELPAGLLMAEAKTTRERIGRDNLNPSRAKQAWQTVRTHVNSPIAIMSNNARMGGTYIEPVRDSAAPKISEEEQINAKDAVFLAAVEAHLASKKAGNTSSSD